MNNDPPIYPTVFSDMYFARALPEATAIPVARACAAIPPAATETGFCAALNAIVEIKDRSPNSAAKTSPNVLRILPLWFEVDHRSASVSLTFK